MKTSLFISSAIFSLASVFSISASAQEVEWCLIKNNSVFTCFAYKFTCEEFMHEGDSCVAMVKK